MLRSERLSPGKAALNRRQRSVADRQGRSLSTLREHTPLKLYVRAAAPEGFAAVPRRAAERCVRRPSGQTRARDGPLQCCAQWGHAWYGCFLGSCRHDSSTSMFGAASASDLRPAAMPVSVRSFVCLFVFAFVCLPASFAPLSGPSALKAVSPTRSGRRPSPPHRCVRASERARPARASARA